MAGVEAPSAGVDSSKDSGGADTGARSAGSGSSAAAAEADGASRRGAATSTAAEAVALGEAASGAAAAEETSVLRRPGAASGDSGAGDADDSRVSSRRVGDKRSGGSEVAAAPLGEEEESEALSTLFLKAQRLYSEIDGSSAAGNDPDLQKQIREGIALFQRCSRLVRSAALFSSNESADELPTEHLRYLLTEFYIGDLARRISTTDLSLRPRHLRGARAALEHFCEAMDKLGLLPAADRNMLNEGTRPRDSGLRREQKIARLREGQAAQRRLKELMLADAREERSGGEVRMDPDDRREMQLLVISDAVRKAVDEILSASQEIEMLEAMAARAPDGPRSGGAGGAGGRGFTVTHGRFASEEEDTRKAARPVAGPVIDPEDPDRPGISVVHIDPTFNVTREQVKATIFRPGHRLPTMSLEEFAEKEREEAMERSKKEAAAEEGRPVSYKTLEEMGREDDEAEVDRSTLKDRNWDDWKDDHTKGVGNTKRI